MSFRSLKLAPGLAVMAALSILVTSCGGGGSVPANAGSSNARPASCPLDETPQLGGTGCGGGPTPGESFRFTEGNYISSATTGANDSANGSATLVSTDASAGTFSGNLNTETGVTTATINMPSVSSQAMQLQYYNGNYIGDGTTPLPSGGSITVSSSGAVATQTDANGNVWTITGAMQSDNRTVTLTYSSAIGTFTANVDSAAWAPAQYAAAQDAARRAAAQGLRLHPDVTATQVAAVATCIAAGAGLVAAVAFVIPGGQGVAGVAGIVAGVFGVVAAGAGAWATFAPQSPAPAPTAAPK
ncbi:MAG TPA: hypothetical protein VMB20_01505 [Candidatus Acidoferrum sp.]|nr:hypothetical protein [Candidatus Acidoferrum sp.]